MKHDCVVVWTTVGRSANCREMASILVNERLAGTQSHQRLLVDSCGGAQVGSENGGADLGSACARTGDPA